MDTSTIISVATPVIVPLIIAAVKSVAPKIPTWALPLLAPFLGALGTLIANAALSHSSNVWLAAGLGLAGVGVREVVDQLKPATPNA